MRRSFVFRHKQFSKCSLLAHKADIEANDRPNDATIATNPLAL